jgi:uncharacterized protein (TIGR02217 family)
VTSGQEFRNSNWLDSRGRWEIGEDLLKKSQIDDLIALFRNRRGRAGGFRFKDWADFQTVYPGVGDTFLPTGGFIQIATGVLQMVRLYWLGSFVTYRIITKPVQGTITLHGVSGTIDYTKGQIAGTGGVDPTTFNGTSFSTTMAWSGEFDLPVRFDVDRFESTFMAYDDETGERLFGVSGLPIVELHPEV